MKVIVSLIDLAINRGRSGDQNATNLAENLKPQMNTDNEIRFLWVHP